MRIGIYTLFLFPGQIGGIEIYVRSLVRYLGKIGRHNDYVIFVGDHNRHIFEDIAYHNYRYINISLVPLGTSVVNRILRKFNILPSYVGKQLQIHPLDLLHYPGTTIDQPDINLPCVLTMHDLQHEYHPEFFSAEELTRRRKTFFQSARKARHIIAISEYTRQGILEKYGVEANKVTTIHHGIDPIFQNAINRSEIADFCAKYKLPAKFMLYPANPWPHKNHARLFAALNLLKQQHRLSIPLVLSGVWANATELKRLINTSNLQDQVYLLNYLLYEELPALYTAATGLVFPSLFEGFGMPVLEAMAVGCPVICSNVTSLPEIAGDAALFVDPLDVAQIALAIYNIWEDPALRQTLRAKGVRWTKNFSWEETARKTLAVYESTV